MISYQPYITLATHTEAVKSQKILELAIGTGTHTLYLAKTMMQRGATLVCTEISPKMLEYAHSKFTDQENEFICHLHNKVNFRINDETLLDGKSKIALDSLREGLDSRDRLIYGIIANNECLPFEDSQFDCYISPLSLQLVHDYKKQLSEALRVC